MPTHILKISPNHFKAVRSGAKKAEMRINDRNFKVNDLILLREYLLDTDIYTGKSCQVRITHILDVTTLMRIGGKHAVLSIELIAK